MVGEGTWAIPKPLFDNLAVMDPLHPTPARMDAAESRFGTEIPPETRDELMRAYKMHFEDASLAVGEYKLGRLTLDEAATIQRTALEDYLTLVGDRLDLEPQEAALIFQPRR